MRHVLCLPMLLRMSLYWVSCLVKATVCESIDLVATISSALMRKCGGDVAYLVSAVGPSFFTPHIDVDRVRHWFSEIKGFSQISRPLQVLSLGAPADVAPGRDLQAEIS